MSSLNKATIIGRVGKDPEVRRMNNGDAVVNLSVATSEVWKKNGEKQERTEWHKIVIFNKHHADFAEKYIHKGDMVYLEGQITTRKWQDRDGQDKYTTEIVLQRFGGELKILSSKDDGQSSGSGYSPKPAPKQDQHDELMDDSIPFN